MRIERLLDQISSAPEAPSLVGTGAGDNTAQERQVEPAVGRYYEEC
jgi:hypothetical protein